MYTDATKSHMGFGNWLALVVLAALLPSSAQGGPDDRSSKSWFARHFSRPTIEEAFSQCAAPKDICRVMEQNVSARSEEVDHWYSLDETWSRGRGDCEDFAIGIERLCSERGLDAHIVLFYPLTRLGDGHAVAVGSWKGRMWVSSMGSYEEVDSLDDVRKSVARELGCRADQLICKPLAHSDIQVFIGNNTAPSVGQVKSATGFGGK